jgi:putative RecB family exonuclease
LQYPKEYLSYSSMSTHRTCGEQFRLLKIEQLPDLPGWYNAGGSAVHAASEAEDHARFTGVKVKEKFNDFFDREIEELEESTGVPRGAWKTAGRPAEGEPWWRLNGPSFVASWRRWLNNTPFNIWVTPEGEPAIEIEGETEIAGVTVRWTIDRILEDADGTLGVVDLKTGKPPKDKVQLATYARGAAARWGDMFKHGGYWMARGGILTGWHDLAPLLEGQLDYQYQQTWKAIEEDIFPAVPSGLCANYCPVNKSCYSYNPGSPEAAAVAPWRTKED